MLLIAIAIRLHLKARLYIGLIELVKIIKYFKMPKFRSMLIDTPAVATHLIR